MPIINAMQIHLQLTLDLQKKKQSTSHWLAYISENVIQSIELH